MDVIMLKPMLFFNFVLLSNIFLKTLNKSMNNLNYSDLIHQLNYFSILLNLKFLKMVFFQLIKNKVSNQH